MADIIKRPGNDADLKVDRCCVCGVEYAVPKIVLDDRLRNGGGWYCPNGHWLVYTDPEVEKVRRERDRMKQQLAQKDDEITNVKRLWQNAEKTASAHKGQVTKLRNRAKNGVCPCCNRHFENLQRHIATKHPDFDPNEESFSGVYKGANGAAPDGKG